MSAPPAQTAAERWRSALADWAIPQEILDAAPASPWQLSPRPFVIRADRALREGTPTPSRLRAVEALPEGGAVLDVGSGAGAASLPLLRRASRLIAVDGDAGMLDELRVRVPPGIDLTLVQGRWPDVADQVDPVDVVVCNHVAYNVPDLDVAVQRMTEKARRRVVLELTGRHPRSSQNFLWPVFHGIGRPSGPTAADAIEVIRAAGFEPEWEEWQSSHLPLASDHLSDIVAATRRYLCLAEDRDPEIAAALEGHLVRRDGMIGLPPLPVVTVWWDALAAAA